MSREILDAYHDQYVPPRAVAASDSETVVDSVELAWRAGAASLVTGARSRLLVAICKVRAELVREWRCQFDVVWIRAHDGNFGNHAADAVAKAAANAPVAPVEPPLDSVTSMVQLEACVAWPCVGTAQAELERSSYSALAADGKRAFPLFKARLRRLRTWQALLASGKQPDVSYGLGCVPALAMERLGWPKHAEQAPRWPEVASALLRFCQPCDDRGSEVRLTTAGVRSTLSSARWALRCNQCPLCGRRDVVAKDASDPTQLGELDRRHFVLADECIGTDGGAQGAPGLHVLKLIDEAIDAAVAAVPGCSQLPTLTRGRPVDTSAELQLHADLERLRAQLGCKNVADEEGQ